MGRCDCKNCERYEPSGAMILIKMLAGLYIGIPLGLMAVRWWLGDHAPF